MGEFLSWFISLKTRGVDRNEMSNTDISQSFSLTILKQKLVKY